MFLLWHILVYTCSLHCTVSTATALLDGQAGSDPPSPHILGSMTLTLQVYSPAEEIVTGDMVKLLLI